MNILAFFAHGRGTGKYVNNDGICKLWVADMGAESASR